MITTEYTEKINSFDDDWQDIKTGSPVINIRVKGTYPKQKVKHHHHVAHPHLGFLPCFNQHKPYGLATVQLQFHDDRPDWYRFNAEKKKRYFENKKKHNIIMLCSYYSSICCHMLFYEY